MDAENTAESIETRDVEIDPRRPNLGESWKIGRTPGRKNNLTYQRREFVEMVVGEPGSPEMREFAAAIRRQFIAGECPPAIAVTIMHWWLGKPTERIQISEGPPDLGNLSDEELAHRARILAAAIEEQRSANTIDVTPQKDALTRAEELTPPRLVKKTA